MLAALLLGAALILPAILEHLLSFGERRAPCLAVWFWADSRQQLSGLSLALMALLLALAVNVGVGTMVESSAGPLQIGWMDDWRLTFTSMLPIMRRPQTSRRGCASGSEVEAILPGGRAEVQMQGAPVEVLGVADHATYRDHWPLLQSGRKRLDPASSGRCRLRQRTIGPAAETAIGDPIEVPAANGNWKLEVVGIYADYGNPKGQIAVNIAALTRRFPAIPMTRMALRVEPEKIPSLIASLQQKFGLDGRNLMDQGALKTELKRIFNRTFAITGALNAFTLGVAGVALLTSLLTLSNSRLPQLAPLWAIGLTRRRLAAIELLKTMSVALITTLLALPLGLLVAWCLIAVVNVKAFGWRLPFHVFPLKLLELLAIAMAAALLAALLPVLKLARMQPAHLVKIFADER